MSMIFSLSPALTPVFGGWVVTLFTWRAIFLTLFAYAVAMLVLCVRSLPETLQPHTRRPFGLGILAQQYVVAFGNRRFRLVGLAIALSFVGLFLYVASVPAFLGNELGLPPTQYAVMFVSIVAGIVFGSLAAERLAGRVASARLILAGFSIQLVTGIVNVTFHAVHAATVPWSILPLGFYAFGMSLATPGLLLTGLDQFPQMRGLAASCQAFANGAAGRSGSAISSNVWRPRACAGASAGSAVHRRFRLVARHDPTLRTECIVPPALWTRSGPTWRSQRNAQQ